jgi:hypothetical protein
MPTKQAVKNLQSTYITCWKHTLDMMISTEKILTEDQGQSWESKRAKSKHEHHQSHISLSLSLSKYLAEVHLSPESSGSAH